MSTEENQTVRPELTEHKAQSPDFQNYFKTGIQSPDTTLYQYLLRRSDELGKIVTFTVAFLYSMGLLITNAHLLRFGISELGLLKPRFVLTGLLFSLPIIIGAIAVQLAFPLMCHICTRFPKLLRWFATRISLFYSLAALMAFVVFYNTTAIWTIHGYRSVALSGAIAVMAIYPFFVLAFDYYDSILMRALSDATSTGLRSPSFIPRMQLAPFPLSLALTALTVASIYSYQFVTRVFPSVPPQFGGGQSRVIDLHLSSTITISGIEDVQQIVQAELLWQTDNGYLLRLDDGTVIFVEEKNVDAVTLNPVLKPNPVVATPES